MISIKEAAATGIARVRDPTWEDPMAHIEIEIDAGAVGRWLRHFAPNNEKRGGHEVAFLSENADLDERIYEAYAGPLPDSDEYLAARTA